MSNLEFSMNLPSEPEELIKFSMDYESFVNYLPDHIKNIVIVETKPDEIITDEILTFRSLISLTIKQKSSHKRNGNVLSTQIISGRGNKTGSTTGLGFNGSDPLPDKNSWHPTHRPSKSSRASLKAVR